MNSGSKKDDYILPCKEVVEVCEPFFKRNNLNGFTYSRVFEDGSRSELWSNHKALEHTFLKKGYIADVYTPDFYSNEEKYVYLKFKFENFSDEKIKNKYLNQLADQKNFFNHDNCFMIVNKKKELCEYFIFYSPTMVTNSINFYLNNTDRLLNFSMAFKEKFKKLIQAADKNKIIKPWRKSGPSQNNTSFYKSIVSFSKRETEIIKLSLEGKTAKEIARIAGISFRTVESYIENLKDKMKCRKKYELLAKIKSGFLIYD